MRSRTIRWLIILGTISIVGIIITQVYWVSRAVREKQADFDQTVRIALQKAAEKNAEYSKTQLPQFDLVKKLASNYYVVNVNSRLDANVLEYYLKQQFLQNNLNVAFEYGIYDCSGDEMVYGRSIGQTPEETSEITTKLPKWNGSDYYFGVRFPNRTTFIANQMQIWIFSSVLLLLVLLLFGYGLFVILKQKHLSEIQKDFINNMTHELKTPISTISISADVLINPKNANRPDRIINYAKIIKTENERLKGQVEKVLQMARIDKQGLKLKIETHHLHEIIESAVENFKLKVHESHGSIHVILDAENSQIEADKVHLTNILYNLLDNAIKYTGNQAPIIKLQTQNKSKPFKSCIALVIKDNGIGIPKEHQKMIFNKFYRVPTGNVHNVKGFGLGLNYVKTVVKAHKWHIALDSVEDQGSTFTIFIPTVEP